MRVTLVLKDGRRLRAKPAGERVELTGSCPNCKRTPFEAKGTGISRHDHDTYYAQAVACCCGAHIGELRAKVSTIFGIEEDERVLIHGRARVYW